MEKNVRNENERENASSDLIRCSWAGVDPLYLRYHDTEWGVPVHDDRKLFEFLLLEGAQAGLSWITILKRRHHYRRAFDGFDPERIARYSEERISDLLRDEGIIRNRQKVRSAVQNAKAFLSVREKTGSFDHYIWQFVHHAPVTNGYRTEKEIPATTPESEKMSRDLKKLGFSFVGPTICYAFMQAVGMVNDHVLSCFRHSRV